MHDVTTAAYWVEPDGTMHRGHLGIGESLKTASLPYSVAGHLIVNPPLSWLAKPIYSVIAKNRHRLPGSTDACRLD